MSTAALKAVATDKKESNPVTAFRNVLEKQRAQIAAALPKHMSPDRMIRLACTEFAKNPTLQKCEAVSVFGGIIQAAQLGLEIGVLGQAYLVPYRNNKKNCMEAQFIPGYKGLIALARRSGEVTSIETNLVYQNDTFDLTLGVDSNLTHKPYLDGERGALRLVYGVAKFKDGGHHLEWMPISDVEKIRARSKASNNGPWVTDYEQMVRKTSFVAWPTTCPCRSNYRTRSLLMRRQTAVKAQPSTEISSWYRSAMTSRKMVSTSPPARLPTSAPDTAIP